MSCATQRSGDGERHGEDFFAALKRAKRLKRKRREKSMIFAALK